jgi:DNA-binding MarR family transcriptional regulator
LSLLLDNRCYNMYSQFVAPKTLRDELKMAKPFKSVEEEALLSIARTAALIEHAGAEAFKPFNLTTTQYNVLRILRGAGQEGLCRNEVGERLVTKVPDVTRLLDRMETAELIARERGGQDRRYVTTRITEAGLKLLEKIDRELPAIHARQLGHVSQKRLRELISILEEVRRAA